MPNLFGNFDQFTKFCYNFHWSAFPSWVNYLKLIGFVVLVWWSILLMAVIEKRIEDVPNADKLEKWQKVLAKKKYPDKISQLWSEIESRMSSQKSFDWQMALSEATQEFLEIFRRIKLPEKNVEEKIVTLNQFDFPQANDLLKSYQFSVELLSNPVSEEVDKEKIQKAIGNYRLFFEWLGLVNN